MGERRRRKNQERAFREDLQTARHILVLCRRDSHSDIPSNVILAPFTDQKEQNSEKASEGPVSHSWSVLELGFKANAPRRHREG